MVFIAWYLKIFDLNRVLGCNYTTRNVFFLARRPKTTKSTRNLAWVCPPYMVGLGNRCYYFSTNESTWTEAHFKCRQNKTKLAVIRNKSQDHNLRRFLNNFIGKSRSPDTRRWIWLHYFFDFLRFELSTTNFFVLLNPLRAIITWDDYSMKGKKIFPNFWLQIIILSSKFRTFWEPFWL